MPNNQAPPANEVSKVEDMLALFVRVRHRLRRRRHTRQAAETSSNREIPRDQRTEDVVDDQYEQDRIRSSPSPSPLPEITDRGPPALHRYENEDIFWNSTMVEAAVDPVIRPARRQQQKSTPRQRQPRNAIETEPLRSVRGPFVSQETSRPPPVRSARNHNDQEAVADPVQESKKDDRSTADVQNHDVTVMRAWPLPNVPLAPSRAPISPATEEWDNFMDFPSENSMHIYRDSQGNRHVNIPVRTLTTATTPATTAKLTSHQSNHELALSSPPDTAYEQRPTASSYVSHDGVLTWNLVLNRILDHEAVDPAMKQAVRERVQQSLTANGDGHASALFVSAQEAGLVPNFSYPLVGSAFYDRIAAEHNSHARSTSQEDPPSAKKPDQLPNGISRSPTPSESSHNTLYRAPTPVDDAPERITSLLSTMLTPSELSLHNRIIKSPLSDASSSQLHTRLILALHIAILGLLDRTTHLEESLIPQLSTWLEEKRHKIDELSLQVMRLRSETVDLKACVDFGNRVLAGCWEREGELWRMLGEARGRRQMGWLRWMGKSGMLGDGEVDALALVAEQNVRILKEDIEEMVSLVMEYKEKNGGVMEVKEVQRMWRDV